MSSSRFSTQVFGSNRRLGFWSIKNFDDIKSPGVWLTTDGTGVPHLVPETVSISGIADKFAGLLLAYENHSRSSDVFEAYGKGFLSFSGLGLDRPCPTMLTIMDPCLAGKTGYNGDKTISVWGEQNQRERVDAKHFIRGVQALKPDVVVGLCDGDIPKDATVKRLRKAITNTEKFTKECFQELTKDSSTAPVFISPLEGGYSRSTRKEEAVKQSKLSPYTEMDGYLLDSFHSNGESSLSMNMDEVTTILAEDVNPDLVREKPRFFFGMCDPLMVLKLVKLNVDFFESSYAYHLTKQGLALTFPNRLDSEELNESLVDTEHNEKTDAKKSFYIDLKNDKFKNDFGPISKSCQCYTCRKHTRGYINHLLATKELLADVLLVIHNLDYYATFFDTIREAIPDEAKFDQLFKTISQFERENSL